MWRNFTKKHQGFTMIEVLLALMATSVVALLLAQIAATIAHAYRQDYRVEDDLAIKQLQLLFAQGSEFSVSNEQCSLRYHGEMISLEQYEDKLIRRTGFEIFLQDIDDVSFTQEGGCVYVSWRRENQEMRNVLGCE